MNASNHSARLPGAHAADAIVRPSPRKRLGPPRLLGALLLLGGLTAPTLTHGAAAAGNGAPRTANLSFAPPLPTIKHLVADLKAASRAPGVQLAQTTPLTTTVGSTVPANGDANPYGVAVATRSMGKLVQGDVLVSNFNNKANLQGTGTTIVEIAPSGTQQVFATVTSAHLPGGCPGGVGLTTALAVLSRGYVIVGSLATTDGTPATIGAGCLIVLDDNGNVVRTFTGHGINGPWDMAADDHGGTVSLFVANVLNGSLAAGPIHGTNLGTIVRLVLSVPRLGKGQPRLVSSTVIGQGFAERTDPDALIIGPTGLGLAANGTLYVADTLENRIGAIPSALTRANEAHTGWDVSANGALNGPLGLAIAPNGDILTVNSSDGKVVETTPAGIQVFSEDLDTTKAKGASDGAGALFGLAVAPDGGFYYVNDITGMLDKVSATSQATLGVASISPQAGSTVNGVAVLKFNPSKSNIDVTVDVAGLAPNSVHPAHIHTGTSCSANGPILYPFQPLKADAAGVAHEALTIPAQSVPATGWYVNVHMGPDLVGAHGTPIGCGVVTRGL
jgi:hypothetical protein